MNKYNSTILVLTQLLLIIQINCNDGYRLICELEDDNQQQDKFFLYLADNGEVFYKLNHVHFGNNGQGYTE